MFVNRPHLLGMAVLFTMILGATCSWAGEGSGVKNGGFGVRRFQRVISLEEASLKDRGLTYSKLESIAEKDVVAASKAILAQIQNELERGHQGLGTQIAREVALRAEEYFKHFGALAELEVAPGAVGISIDVTEDHGGFEEGPRGHLAQVAYFDQEHFALHQENFLAMLRVSRAFLLAHEVLHSVWVDRVGSGYTSLTVQRLIELASTDGVQLQTDPRFTQELTSLVGRTVAWLQDRKLEPSSMKLGHYVGRGAPCQAKRMRVSDAGPMGLWIRAILPYEALDLSQIDEIRSSYENGRFRLGSCEYVFDSTASKETSQESRPLNPKLFESKFFWVVQRAL
jgi:hypothetical protein